MEQQFNELFTIFCPYLDPVIFVETNKGEKAAIKSFILYLNEHPDEFKELLEQIKTSKRITRSDLVHVSPGGCKAFKVDSKEVTAEWIKRVHEVRDIENIWVTFYNLRMARVNIPKSRKILLLNENGEFI